MPTYKMCVYIIYQKYKEKHLLFLSFQKLHLTVGCHQICLRKASDNTERELVRSSGGKKWLSVTGPSEALNKTESIIIGCPMATQSHFKIFKVLLVIASQF